MCNPCCKYFATGKAWSESDAKQVDISGIIIIDCYCKHDNNGYTYSICSSELVENANKLYGSGNIFVRFLQTPDGWDNMSRWVCGEIDSLVETDVVFYDEALNPLDMKEYDKLPCKMALKHGMIPNKYSDIDLNLSIFSPRQVVPLVFIAAAAFMTPFPDIAVHQQTILSSDPERHAMRTCGCHQFDHPLPCEKAHTMTQLDTPVKMG